jgi:hypothetical protein
MAIARAVDGVIVERRDITINDVPPHKLAALGWKALVEEGSGQLEQIVIEADQIRVIHAPSVNEVAIERTRRLSLGFDYDFGDSRGVHRIGTTDADLKGWDEVSTYAGALIDSGDVETLIAIATDTGLVQVTAPEWRAVEVAAAEFRQPLWALSFALMAQSPIPEDYTNDTYWT